jgi:probable biosynthetic protein (TIGR04098 family)
MAYVYDLTLGLPHTNHRGLSEPLLLMQAGHFQWASIAAATGGPLSRLRTSSGDEVYAAFYYIEEQIPDHAPLESFGLDDVVRFAVALRSFKNIAVEGRLVFDSQSRLADVATTDAALAERGDIRTHPSIRFGNIFITPAKGNTGLRVAPPVGADFSRLTPLPNDDNPYHFTRSALETGTLGLFDDTWSPAGPPFEYRYAIDPDRDTNGAGLVYFAQYVTFMETAERLALTTGDNPFDPAARTARSLRHRRIAYYGNADASDTITVRVSVLRHLTSSRWMGLRYAVERQEDGQRICLSEALKFVGLAV